MEEQISNPASERVVLSGIIKHGSEAFIDVDDIIDVSTFTLEQNQIIYACLKKTLENSSSIDLPSVLSAAEDLGMTDSFKDRVPPNHIQGLMNFDVQLENVRTHAKKLKKLEIARDVRLRAKRVIKDINDVTGDESVDTIISIGESPFFELSSTLNNSVEDRPITLGDEVSNYIQHLEENPCDMLGLSSGFARFDAAIGGGFRRKCVDLIAARPKTGKSMLADNVAAHIATELKVPVLILDTEMSREDHFNRLLARFSGININDISTGKFTKMVNGKERIAQAAEKIKDVPFDYITIAGKPFEETLSIIRRWIVKRVGFDENGRTNDCMVIYDYLKLMASNEINDSMKEFQVLGFQITKLHNLTVEYDFPCLSFVQLNRDGITKESTDVVSGSDRLIWLCSSFTIFKTKSDEEMAEDNGATGNRKLIPIVTRHGGGLDDYDYINIDMKGEIGTVEEMMTKSEALKGTQLQREGFVIEDGGEAERPF
tara:strand:- start:34177 stop:35634 length:1458 start_codon:yes stop_codon:yes gene_type:complete